jgi:glycosyltransferase involved in cell wall biosynthesis
VTVDFVACEPQFIDHAAPVWRAVPSSVRGRFLVDGTLMARAEAKGIDAVEIDANVLRFRTPPPKANPGDGPTAFVVSIGDTKVARRLGYRRFVFMEHGAGQAYTAQAGINARNPSYAGGIDREDVGLFLVPNEYSAALWRAAYPAASVAVIGCPKLDDLPARNLDGPAPVVAISFHWPAFVAPEAGNALGTFLPALAELAKRYQVIGHAHPKGDWPERMERIYRRAGIEFVRDFDEVCRRADVYVCDNSSTLFEFAATGRPVVVMNDVSWRRNAQHGLRFWDAAHVGVNVDRADRLVDAVAEALDDRAEQRAMRSDALDIVYAYRTGAAERASAAIQAWAPAAVAA